MISLMQMGVQFEQRNYNPTSSIKPMRMKMSAPKQSLTSLMFAVLPKLEANPVLERRNQDYCAS